MKISVIGAGAIGASLAYKIADQSLADELVLVDIAKDLAIGQYLDIAQSLAFTNGTDVSAGDYRDTSDSDMVVISAGKPRRPGIDRLHLINDNKAIVREIVKDVLSHSPDAILMTMTNPLDVMNYAVWKASGLPRNKVIGSGGQLDSARFRFILSKEFNTKPIDVEGYVIGEHGNSQTPVFSRVKLKGEKVEFDEPKKDELHEKLKKSAMDVIEKKNSTIFAPINCTSQMIASIVNDSKKLLPCSAVLDGEYDKHNLSLGVPTILGKNGIEEIQEWELDEWEKKVFDEGAEKIVEYCKHV